MLVLGLSIGILGPRVARHLPAALGHHFTTTTAAPVS
jgi:hypothetical protein